jgi:hypothetical protein
LFFLDVILGERAGIIVNEVVPCKQGYVRFLWPLWSPYTFFVIFLFPLTSSSILWKMKRKINCMRHARNRRQ